MYRIAIAGTGYVGLVTGVCLASKGFPITCVDVNQDKIDMLNRGECPIYEPGLREIMLQFRNNLTYTTDSQSAYQNADVIFIGVGTPERRDGSANLDYVYTVADEIAEFVAHDCIIVLKSTVPIGTNHQLIERIKRHLKNPVNVEIASNPEFLSQGTAVKDTLQASRIIIGADTPRAAKVLQEIYQHYGQPILFTDICSAEMIKYASNDFLALKISYINEIANLCEITGADVESVAQGMGMDPRIGNKFLKAGIGYGGSCFPKDTKALHWLANFNDYEMKTIRAAIDVNENQKLKLFKKSRKYYENLRERKVTALGLTFKPNTDDLRDAPSLQNIPLFTELGAKVYAWDPVGEENFRKIVPDTIAYCSSIEEALKDSEICFIFTEWDAIKMFDVHKYSQLMKTPVILDGRNCYSLSQIKNEPVIYDSIGRKTICNYKFD
jgi:UDPglucose 6-dehydrogenase